MLAINNTVQVNMLSPMELQFIISSRLNSVFPFSYLSLYLGQGHYHMPETRGLCLSEELSTVRFPVLCSVLMTLQHIFFGLVIGFFLNQLFRIFGYIAFKLDQFSRRPRLGTAMDMRAQPYRPTTRCDVTAILVLYGLPR